MSPEETLKDIMERFDLFWGIAPEGTLKAKKKEDTKAFLKDSLIKFGESLIGADDTEGVTGSEYAYPRNELRAQQRQELEKISK